MTTITAHSEWAIFPCLPNGKAPWGKYAKHGHNSASSDPNAWANVPSEANWGIACAASGLVVIDIDSGDIPDWCPATYTVRTGRGWHIYYLAQPGDAYRGKIGDSIDIKHHGYVIAAGSRHPDGHLYEVTDPRQPAPLTDDLRSLLLDDLAPIDHHRGSRTSRRVGKYREFLQAAWTDAPTRPAVRQDSPVARVNDQEVACKTETSQDLRAIVTGMRIVENPTQDEGFDLVLVRPAKGKKLHAGAFINGQVHDYAFGCNRDIKDPVAVVGFAGGAYYESQDYVNHNYPLGSLCASCFGFAKYAQS